MSSVGTFRTPVAKKAIKVAQDMGLTVTGFEACPDGTVRVLTAAEPVTDADAALERWLRSQRGKA